MGKRKRTSAEDAKAAEQASGSPERVEKLLQQVLVRALLVMLTQTSGEERYSWYQRHCRPTRIV